jgi:glycosyltransferase involved in cell wall biosynthesis
VTDKDIAILQVVPALDAGGVERTTVEMTAALSQIGWRSLVASQGGRMEPDLSAAGGKLLRLPLASKAPHVMIANALHLARLVRQHRAAIVHARSRAPAWSALIAARMTGVPFVTTYHGFYNASNGVKRFYNSVMVRGKAAIANSQWTAEHIAREYRGARARIVVIPRGVDLAVFHPAAVAPERVARLRQDWAAQPDELVVLLPGRLTRWKGQRVLIDAMAQLARQNQASLLRAVLIGDAQGRRDYKAELRAAIAANGLEGRIVLADHVGDMAAAYLAADIVVSASTDPEAFGRVAAEGAAMGRPVIATDHGGARETVLPNASGLLVAPGNALALANALNALIAAGADVRAAMGAKGRAHIAARYTVDRMCADTIALYRELIAPVV